MLEFSRTDAGYSRGTVLHDITLRLRPGEITAIGGPNGCGKSTLLKLACGLLTPTSGQVLLDGKALHSLSPQERALHVAYLPQGRNVPELTAFRMVLHGRFPHLSFPRRYTREDVEAAEAALRWVDSEELSDRSMATLSGGQRQRIYLAMALAQETDIILMDEPTTYLDIKARFEVMELAHRLAALGKTVVIVLHDLDLLLRYADRAILLQDGRVVADGTPGELCKSGLLEQVFGVRVHCVETPEGREYYFRPTTGN